MSEDQVNDEATTFDIGHLKNETEAKWYPIPGAPKAQIRIKKLKPKARKELYAKYNHRHINRRTNTYIENFDNEGHQAALLLLSVVEWKGISKDEEEYPCNDENKRWLDDNWSEFNTLWSTVAGGLKELDDAMQAAELGN